MLRLQLLQNLLVSREAVGFVFAEDHLAIDDDVEDTAFAFDQRRIDSGCSFDRFRQTGGLGRVVSLHAIGNRNLHRQSSFGKNHLINFFVAAFRAGTRATNAAMVAV